MVGLAQGSPLLSGDTLIGVTAHRTASEWKPPAQRFFKRQMFDDGILIMPNGHHINFWGFQDPLAAVPCKSLPSPLIRLREGETAQVQLEMPNPQTQIAGRQRVSDKSQAGFRERTALTDSVIYQWCPQSSGTWLYQHQASTPHDFEMGLYGLLVVDPEPDSGGRPLAFKRGPAYDIEKLWVLDDVDPAWHANGAADAVHRQIFDPQYFLINGIANSNASRHPGAAIRAKRGEKLLLRMLNASYSLLKVTIENFNGDIVAVDGTPIDTVACPWKSWIPVRPSAPLMMATGSRYDVLIDLDLARNPSVPGRDYKVIFEFLDQSNRYVRNASATDALHTGRVITTIRVDA
jgi:hypothetical protein